MEASILTIGKVAQLSAVPIETIRFYERSGLVPKPSRSAAGYRQYRQDVVARLTFIQRAKALGFSLKEISELLALRIRNGRRCEHVQAKATAKLADVETKLNELQRIREALKCLLAECDSRNPTTDECPILRVLEAAEH